MAIKNKVQLITYPDSLGGDLKTLNQVLLKYFPGIFEGGIHILPPFPSSGDRGFAPLTYFDIDPKFGTWADIRALGDQYDILVDLMVNHISRQSSYVQDFLKKGRESEFADLFITLDKVWDDGVPVQDDIRKMFRRREVPYSSFTIEQTKEQECLWTTFGKEEPSEQIDLDVGSLKVKRLFKEIIENFSRQNVKIIRLDAIGYVIKKVGTSCFFVEPEIYEFLDWILELASSYGIELLPEVHSHYTIQRKLAEHGCWIYDFILPYTILDALLTKSGKKLCEYLENRPANQFTMLDCHDGIPVKPDLDDLIDTMEAREIIETCRQRGSNVSLILSDEHKAADGFDVHQIRCSYYSVLNCEDDAYLAARALQFFAPGIPQIYYVGLLAGENDLEGVSRTGEGREINRHNFSMEEIGEAVQKSVVQRLLQLIRFRNSHPAFDGEFKVVNTDPTNIALVWQKDDVFCQLNIDLATNQTIIEYVDSTGELARYHV